MVALEPGAPCRVVITLLLVVLSGCTPEEAPGSPSNASGGRSTLVQADPEPPVVIPQAAVEDYVEGFEFAVDLAWDGRDTMFVTQKSGAIRVVVGNRLLSKPCVQLEVNRVSLSGLMGIQIDPMFEQNHYLYAYYTKAHPYENRVTRFMVRDNKCTSPRHIISGIPASRAHNGGRMDFVGDKLFVTTGDETKGDPAQDLDSLAGKVLRYNADGSIPEGNPFSQPGDPSPVWSYGHRNPFGLAHRPGTNQLFETENGPTCNDELNLITKGANYGWPSRCSGEMSGDDPTPALLNWAAVIVPSDLWWYEGRIGDIAGALLMAEFRRGRVHRFVMNQDGTRVLEHTVVYEGADRVIDIAEGPGGWLYILETGAIKRMILR